MLLQMEANTYKDPLVRDLQSHLEKMNVNFHHDWRELAMEFSNNVGDDPLLPWLRFIKRANSILSLNDLNKLLQTCTKIFQYEDKYKSDIRYLKLWILYADGSQSFELTFSIMEAMGIGIYHSLFYEVYATYLEGRKELLRANAVYQLGISRQAQPLSQLKYMYKSFLKRNVQIASPLLQKIEEHYKSFEDGSVTPINALKSLNKIVATKDDLSKLTDVQANHTMTSIVSCSPCHLSKKNDDVLNNHVQETNEFVLPAQDVKMHDLGGDMSCFSHKSQDNVYNQENRGMGHLIQNQEVISNDEMQRCLPLNSCSQLVGVPEGVESVDKPLNINECGKLSRKQGLNPWSSKVICNHLGKLKKQILKYKGYNVSNKAYSGKTCLSSLRNAARNKLLDLGGIKYHIKGCSGEGAFAQVFRAHVDGCSDDTVALKIQRPACPWEFYMYRQLDERIPEEERSSFGSAWKVHVYADCSILVCDYVEHGTLQDVINSYLVTGQCMDEVLCMYYTIELLRIFEVLHSTGFIHGDVKPDNLLIRYASNEISEEWDPSRRGGWKDQGLCLIDWGRGIDLRLFPSGTEFEADSRTSAFRCIEMQENRPWTFQADTYAVCVIAHMMLHGSYMEVVKQTGPDGSCLYCPKAPFKRYWNGKLWKSLFMSLLNIKSCTENPDLGVLRKEFEDYLSSSLQLVKKLKQLLMKQRTVMCSAK